MDLPRHYRLHLFALTSFAVSQPLYDLIGRNAEFLVAHRAGPWTIGALIAILSLALPLALIAIVDAVRLASARAAGWVQRILVGLLAGLVAANIVARDAGGRGARDRVRDGPCWCARLSCPIGASVPDGPVSGGDHISAGVRHRHTRLAPALAPAGQDGHRHFPAPAPDRPRDLSTR